MKPVSLSLPQVAAAVSAAKPAEGTPWNPDVIRDNLAEVYMAQYQKEVAEEAEWQAAYDAIKHHYVPDKVRAGAAGVIAQWQVDTKARHHAQVEATIKKNQAIVSGIVTTLATLATTAATGGVTAPVVAEAFLGVATQISSALNEDA